MGGGDEHISAQCTGSESVILVWRGLQSAPLSPPPGPRTEVRATPVSAASPRETQSVCGGGRLARHFAPRREIFPAARVLPVHRPLCTVPCRPLSTVHCSC